MKHFIRGGFVAFLWILSHLSWAQNDLHFSPPAPYAITVELPDGQSLNIIAKGNDDFHWTETTDGYTVLKNKEGYYEYARESEGQLISSGIRATDPEHRSMQEMRQLLSLPKHAKPKVSRSIGAQLRTLTPQSSTSTNELVSAVPSQGKVKLLAICIEYPDLPHSKEADYFSRMLNEGVDGKPSFREYYLKNSYGKLDLSIDVVGWVKASKGYAYYGEHNGKERSRELVKEAIQAAEALGVDYSQYDNDLDDDVDAVIVIHSGPGAEEGGRYDYVWSHRWTMPFEYFDNKFIFDYTIQPETRTAAVYGGSVGIGIFCHEFGHLLGLPDLYDTETGNGDSHGIGEWGLMGLGQWLGWEDYPASMSAWSKAQLGWAEVVDITQSFGRYNLRPASQNPQVYRIETGRSNEYFLLENRQRQDLDQYLKGNGLAIWHINSNKTDLYPGSNNVNGDSNLKGVDLEEADGNTDLDQMRNRSDGGDLYPGNTEQRTFNIFSNPTSESYFSQNNSRETGISIENIVEATDGTVSFTHSRVFANGGANCENALMALRGENQVSSTPSWFEFTMPVSGSLQISTQAAGRPTSGAVYLNCSSSTPIAQATSRNDGSEHTPMNIEYVAQGQKILIQWNAVAGQNRPFAFSINIEGSVALQDSLALVAMYNQMGGANWSKKARWLSGPVSGWEGVSVENRRVTKLEFNSAGLRGNFPAEFYNLRELRSLSLIDNQISGGLDNRFGQLDKLEEVIIRERSMSATFLSSIPSLRQLKNLTTVDVRLNGSLPANIEQLTQLEHLEIHNAALTGSIPSGIGRLTKLKNLILSNNQLTGGIPAGIGGLWELQNFKAENNRLDNAVPAELMALPALQTLSLENNRLTALPLNFFSSNVLTSVNVSNNQIVGNLPTSVNRSSTVALEVNLSKNQLRGVVSEALTRINFSQLDLSENQLEGSLPALRVAALLNIASNNFSALSRLNQLQQGSVRLVLQCQNNRLTFDDLLPNIEFLRNSGGSAVSERYSPQNILKSEINQVVNQGASVTVTLEYDSEVTTNRYAWSLNNSTVATTEQRSLTINDFNTQRAGTYVCRITNTQLPGLTLTVDDIQLGLRTKEEQTITVEAIPAKTFGDAAFDVQASSSANLPLTYSRISGPITINGSRVTITGAGEARLRVNQAGNDTYHEEETEVTFTIAKASQTINDISVPTKTYGEASFSLNVRASSGLPVVLAIENGNVSLNNNIVTIQGVGEVSISASQAGNDNYLAAESKLITFEVVKASQSIGFAEIEDQVYGNDPLSLSPTATSGLPVSIRVVEGPALWNSQQLVITGAGSVIVEAAQAGNENYLSADVVRRIFEVAKAGQQIFFDEIMDRELSDPPLELEAYSSVEGLEVSFSVIEGDAEINGNILTIHSDGKITIEASQPGNNNYQAAIPRQRSFFVTNAEKQTQTIVLKALPDTVSILDQLDLEWTVSSGLEPEIILEGPAVLQNNQLSFSATGEVNIRIEQKGNDEYNAALPLERSLWVSKAIQNITVTKPKDAALQEESIELKAVSNSGLTVLFRVISGGVSLDGNILLLQEEGEVILEAYQPGDDMYEAAVPQRFSFRIYAEERLSQTIGANEIADKTFGDDPFDLDIQSSSDLPLTLEASGPISLEGQKVIIEGAGNASILVYQEGNEDYAPSDTLTLSFVILPAPQILQFELEKIGENVYLLKASSNADLPVVFELVSGEAEIQGDTLVVTGEERVEIMALQDGNANYQAADPVSRIVEEGKVTSIGDDLLAQKIKIYPNPSYGIFNLDLGEYEERVLRVYDIKGRLVRHWESGLHHEAVDLSSHAPGVYLLSVEEKGKTRYYRIIKQ